MSNELVKSTDYAEEIKLLPPEIRNDFGIGSVDNITGGYAKGELIVSTGYTGHGKTTFFQSISYNMAKKGIKMIWISYELTSRQFFSKYPNEVPEFYMVRENKPYDLAWIEEKIIEGKEKYGIEAIFIDHLHYVVNMDQEKGSQYTLLVGDTMRRLKQMAVYHDITVFLIAHTKQPNDSESPGLGSIRDSSFIAQESDAVYSVQRKRKRGSDDYEELTTFFVLKQRSRGEHMGKTTKLAFHKGMLFDEIDYESERAL